MSIAVEAPTAVPSGCPLSPRQHEAILGVVHGQTYQRIADRLHVAHCTVGTYVLRAYRRLGVNNAAQARTVMIREGWLTLADSLLADDALPGRLPDYPKLTYTTTSRRGCRNWLPTPAQRLYLDALDRFLRDRGEYRHGRAGGCRHIVYFERELPAPPRKANDFDGLIAKIAPAICTRPQLDVLRAAHVLN